AKQVTDIAKDQVLSTAKESAVQISKQMAKCVEPITTNADEVATEIVKQESNVPEIGQKSLEINSGPPLKMETSAIAILTETQKVAKTAFSDEVVCHATEEIVKDVQQFTEVMPQVSVTGAIEEKNAVTVTELAKEMLPQVVEKVSQEM